MKDSGVKNLIDTRLHNVSQLAGFAKRDDLKFFCENFAGITYRHELDLAPTQEMLDEFRDKNDWSKYEKKFLKLIEKRKIEKHFKIRDLNGSCFLCSEQKPHHCHRRLVAEYLQTKFTGLEVEHLV